MQMNNQTLEDLSITFLEKTVLGRKTDFNIPDSVIDSCIRKADGDMLTAGRFYLPKDSEKRRVAFKNLLKDENYVFSRGLIEKTASLFGDKEIIGSGKKYATRFGLAQKLVNMTYKYLYVYKSYIDLDIDFSHCDCPLDSVILEKINYTQNVWSKVTKAEYEDCQTIIKNKIQKCGLYEESTVLGNLVFDFRVW
ncbi:MAG: hypothetical protein IJI19_00360 [Ruminococcus sp.]|nr:hypothetical protein [Ruminococcus sp.]